ncbi:ROK family protein [Desemzia sp. RIT804]|uniref:ROK family protein n=1 Tax=Desemzia sp. RIT 804 TaxID=2810209 RepID=UPI00194FBC10|nr:ROK family protein [Desemzia sp. RIT 804]MBM6614495.1 ROK family protein [Desemzia sp. RIT 804]
MGIVAFDIGGTSVKYAFWQKDILIEKGSFLSPTTWNSMKEELKKVKDAYAENYIVEGVAISSPGAVNQAARVVEGASALPYLHHFPIYDELEEIFECEVAMENDANCAALAEVWKGSAKGLKNVLMVVVGTGIGGSVIINGGVQHGAHLFGGEFGFMLLNETQTFSQLGTAVQMARRYCKRKDLPVGTVSGEEVFRLAETGDEVAAEEVETFYMSLARGIYNLQYSYDPDLILLGGGVSNKTDILEELEKRFEAILKQVGIAPFIPKVETCYFKSEANLIGAVYNYMQQSRENRGIENEISTK